MKEKGKVYEAERRDFFRDGEDGNVESCRTVLEDMPEKLGYNVHKHNSYRHLVRLYCLWQGHRQGTLWEKRISGGNAMLRQVATNTNVIIYLMAVVGVLGVLAKLINHFTLRRLVKAAGNMPKSTHKLIKLVRAKYEHACMIHDSVENIDAFVEKYIYEYRGCLFRIHTWRQIELLSVWFAGILAALGASAHYLTYGFNESVYQYIAAGVAEMVLLSVVSRLSDEPYKINAVKMYMVDYLENICALRLKKQRQTDREEISVIAADTSQKPAFQNASQPAAEQKVQEKEEKKLSINIEGEPRNAEKGDAARQAVRRTVKDKPEEDDRPVLREEAIRQILEEFLA